MNPTDMQLFALTESREFGQRVSAALGVPLGEHEERHFEDGEHKTRALQSVRGRDVFVIQSLYGEPGKSVNDKLCRLLFFIGALKDASAQRVTAILPYLCYARKDRKSKSRDPVTTRYVARLLEAVETDRVVTLDVHNLAAFENAFRCRIDHLEARGLFVEHFAPVIGHEEVVVVSPDVGGVKRAEQFRQALSHRLGHESGSAFLEKYRSAGVVSGEAVVGDVRDKVAIIIDDLISTGGTILRAANACRQRGAKSVYAAASHGIFVGNAAQVIADAGLERLVIADTIPPFRLDAGLVQLKLTVLETAPLFAEAIRRIHSGGSIVELLALSRDEE
ncbi:MAG: ribose-phosphate pyrophosphokinase [Betaproteobacteria bacterium RIFCSPLOWO2_12_FULL_62_13]|nr:MAG: ribose-phosphate pyrophosphokinase [Betaproteobacteria bacterium RIFCSPLOWO2_12_FULL_62_13]